MVDLRALQTVALLVDQMAEMMVAKSVVSKDDLSAVMWAASKALTTAASKVVLLVGRTVVLSGFAWAAQMVA